MTDLFSHPHLQSYLPLDWRYEAVSLSEVAGLSPKLVPLFIVGRLLLLLRFLTPTTIFWPSCSALITCNGFNQSSWSERLLVPFAKIAVI